MYGRTYGAFAGENWFYHELLLEYDSQFTRYVPMTELHGHRNILQIGCSVTAIYFSVGNFLLVLREMR
jgi:hypothetical protein